MKKTRRNRGYSLLEVVIASAILVLVMATVYMSLFRSTAEYETNSRRAWIMHQARVALDEMAEDLRQSNRLSLLPIPAPPVPPATETAPVSTMSFKKALAPVAGVATYTANNISYVWMKADGVQKNVTEPF